MLEINPYLRKSASELLKSETFDELRIPKLELPAPSKIHLKELKSNKIGDFRAAVCKEVGKIKKHYKK